ncbi:uncharacterized protein LOC144424534 [Styela clava]
MLKVTVKEFSPQCQKFPTFSTSSLNRCLTSTDLNHLWLAYFNVVHFNTLPLCFFPNISSACNARNYLGIKVYPGLEVQLDFISRNKLDESFYSNLHADLDVAIKNSSSNEDPLSALQLLRERLRLEISQQKWENAANSCKFLCKTMTNAIQKLSINEETITQIKKGVTGISITWADVLVKKGDSLSATQVYFWN